MAFRWRADDGPTLNAGLVALVSFVIFQVIRTSFARKSYIFNFFQGGVSISPVHPSGSAYATAFLIFDAAKYNP